MYHLYCWIFVKSCSTNKLTLLDLYKCKVYFFLKYFVIYFWIRLHRFCPPNFWNQTFAIVLAGLHLCLTLFLLLFSVWLLFRRLSLLFQLHFLLFLLTFRPPVTSLSSSVFPSLSCLPPSPRCRCVYVSLHIELFLFWYQYCSLSTNQ